MSVIFLWVVSVSRCVFISLCLTQLSCFLSLRWPQEILELFCTDGHLLRNQPPLKVFKGTEEGRELQEKLRVIGIWTQAKQIDLGAFSILPFIHLTTLEELRGLGIVEESVPALFLCLGQRAQHVPGGDVAGLTLEFLQAVLCNS